MEVKRSQAVELTQIENKKIEDLLAIIESEDQPSHLKCKAANKFAYSLFIPWTDEKVIYGNHRYFIECNGPKILIEAIKSASSDLDLELALISACWNFSGSYLTIVFINTKNGLDETQLALVKAGAIPVAISLIKSEDPEKFENGIGWIWGFLEHEELLDDMIKEGIIDLLADKINDDSLTLFTTCDYRTFGCAQSVAFNQNCRTILLKCAPKLVAYLLDDANHSLSSDIHTLTRNHIGLTLAYLTNDERIKDYVPIEDAYKALSKFVGSSSADSVFRCESTNGYLWSVPMLFLPLIETDIVEVQRVGAFALSYLTKSDVTRQHIIDTNMIDRVTVLSYSDDGIVRHFGTAAVSNFKTKQIPSLKSFAYWRLMRSKGVKECKRLLNDYNISL